MHQSLIKTKGGRIFQPTWDIIFINKRHVHCSDEDVDATAETEALHMKLKGQMKYLHTLDSFIYLATPMLVLTACKCLRVCVTNVENNWSGLES